MRKMKIYILPVFMLFIVAEVEAQSRILPVSELPTSSQSLSLGNVRMGNMNSALIYNNPTAIFDSTPINDDYSLGFIPSGDDTYLFHTLTAGYKRGKSGFVVGGRYLSMGSFDNWLNTDMADEPLGKIRFYSYTLDLGYAYKLNESFSFYSTMGYVEEKTTSAVRAYRLDVGSYYKANSLLFDKEIDYSIGLEVGNIEKYTYSGNSDFLAPNARLGASAMTETVANQSIGVFVEGGVFLPVANNEFASSFAAGIDYSFFKKYSISLGGHTGEQDDFLSAGFGVKYSLFDFSFGTKIALLNDLNDMYMLGLKIGI